MNHCADVLGATGKRNLSSILSRTGKPQHPPPPHGHLPRKGQAGCCSHAGPGPDSGVRQHHMATGRLGSPRRENKEKNSTVISSPFPKGLPSVPIPTNATSVTTLGLNKLVILGRLSGKVGAANVGEANCQERMMPCPKSAISPKLRTCSKRWVQPWPHHPLPPWQ